MRQRIFTSGINRNQRIIPVASIGAIPADVEDTFTRANTSTIGTTEIGGLTWTESNDPRIVNGKFQNGSNLSSSYAIVDTGQSDVTIKCIINLLNDGASRSIGIMHRYSSSINYFFAYVVKTSTGVTTIELHRVASGADSILISSNPTINANTDYELKVVLSGNTHQVYIDDALMIQTDNTSFVTATSHGLRVATGIGFATADNFQIFFP